MVRRSLTDRPNPEPEGWPRTSVHSHGSKDWPPSKPEGPVSEPPEEITPIALPSLHGISRLPVTTHYDNYNFFVIGFSTTERPSDCMVSLGKILLRSGNQNRFIRLENAAALTRPEVKAS